MQYSDEVVEKFGKVNPDTGEIEVDRLALKKDYVERGVYLLNEVDMLKADLKALLDDSKELHGFDKAALGKLVKYVHKNTIDSDIVELEEIQVQISNMFDEGSEEE